MLGESETTEIDKRYRIAFELSPDAININRLRDGLYIDVNEGFTKLTGYTRSDVIGKTSIDIGVWVNPDDRINLVRKLDKYQCAFNFRAEFRRKDGTVTTGVMSAKVVQLNGEVCILSVTRDIAEIVYWKNELNKSEAHYRHLVETAHAIPWIVDLSTWRFTYVGPQARDLLGFDVNDWYEAGFWENHIHPEDRDRAVNYCKEYVDRQENHDFEYRMVAIDNSTVWVRDNVVVVSDGSGPTHLQGFMFDITKSKQAEQILQRKNHQLELLSTSCQHINSVLDSKTVIRKLVLAGIDLLNASSGAAGIVENGKLVFREYVTQHEYKNVKYTFEPGVGVPGWVLKTKQPYISNDAKNDPNVIPEIREELQFYNCVNVPILDKAGHVVGCVEIHNSKNKHRFDQQDVGMLQGLASNVAVSLENAWAMQELERAVNSQRRFTQRLQLLQEIDRAILTQSSPSEIAKKALRHIDNFISSKRMSVVLLDRAANRGRVLAVVGEDNKEISAGSMIDLHADFVGKLEKSAYEELVDLEKRNKETRFSKVETNIKKFGILRVFHAPLIAHGKAMGVLNVGLDKNTVFTDEQLDIIQEAADSLATAIHHAQLDKEVQNYTQELESRVAARTAELEYINKEMEAFSYSVSHDLRAPLRAISGFASVLKEEIGNTNALANDCMARIVRATKKMDSIINDLLGLSKVNLLQLNPQHIDLAKIAREVVNELREAEPNRNVQFASPKKMPAYGDHGLLKIALQNLLSNAWKYTRYTVSPCIEFREIRKNDERVFYVKDNGAGFESKYGDKLFVAFQRLHAETEFEGAGVGLATVDRIIQRHKGRIWAESQPAKGATFYFTLPDNEVN